MILIFNCNISVTQFHFNYPGTTIDVVERYRYLGVLYTSDKNTHLQGTLSICRIRCKQRNLIHPQLTEYTQADTTPIHT